MKPSSCPNNRDHLNREERVRPAAQTIARAMPRPTRCAEALSAPPGCRPATSGRFESCRQVINDNYFGRSATARSAGRWTARAECETARFPPGGRVGHGRTGSAFAREEDGREDTGGGRGGGRDERADGAPLAGGDVAVGCAGGAAVAHAGGPVRGCVGVGGGAAVGGRHRRPAAGADAVHGAVPAASWPLSVRAAPHVAAAGPCVAGGARPGPGGVLRAGVGSGSGGGVRLHRRGRAGSDASGRQVPAPAVRVGAELQPVDVCGAGAERDVRGAGVGSAGCAVDAGRCACGAAARQPVGGDARVAAQRRAPVDGAVPAGAGALRAAFVADSAREAARERGGRAVPLPDEDGDRTGAALAGQPGLRRRVGVSGVRAGGRRSGAECAGGGPAGRGTGVSAAVAAVPDPGVHDVPVPSAEVEHDSGRRPDLFGSVAVDRSHGRGSPASVDGRGRPWRAGAVHDAASAGRGGAPDRLPARHRESGAEAGRLCAVSLPGGVVPVADVPVGV